MKKNRALHPALRSTVEQLTIEFDQIPNERKESLRGLTNFIQGKINEGKEVSLNFICTHNSRRSHLSQLWAQAAAYYYGLNRVACFSGGTDATAFNTRAVKAMQDVGFMIVKIKDGDNPVYEVSYSDEATPVMSFSKKYDDPFNPTRDFAAIMTCSQADDNCPLVMGASARIAITYNDPKDYDGTIQESAIYAERVRQIGREILYAFSKVNP